MFHREGYKIIIGSMIILVILILSTDALIEVKWLETVIMVILLFFYVLILQFFRNPKRHTAENSQQIIAPADGKVVVIEEVIEKEFFKEKRRQISIFMSPLNVHVTRYPVSGKVILSKYHPGKYMVAWHPKSSEENERTTVVIENKMIGNILYRQIAGAVARRIVNYATENESVVQGADAGFIKFGSRLDVFIPLDMKINVSLNDEVRGGETVIAEYDDKA